VTQDLEQAAAAYESLLDTHQTDFIAHYNLAGVYLAMRNYEQSRAHYSMALQVDSTVPDVRAALAIVHSALGQYQNALRLFDEQEARFGYRPPTAHSRLKTLFLMGDENAVTEQLRQFRERAPDALARDVAEWTEAELAARRGQLARAIRHRKEGGRQRLESRNVLGPLAAALWIVNAKLTMAHDTGRARSGLSSALRSNPLQTAPLHDRPYLPIVTLLIRVGQVEQARQLLAEYERTIATELRGDTRQAMARIRAFTALHERRFSSAIDHYAQKFVHLWREADPELQPRVAAKQRMVQRLKSP
jgi:tetratricopeptide (TPR) repeat protein